MAVVENSKAEARRHHLRPGGGELQLDRATPREPLHAAGHFAGHAVPGVVEELPRRPDRHQDGRSAHQPDHLRLRQAPVGHRPEGSPARCSGCSSATRPASRASCDDDESSSPRDEPLTVAVPVEYRRTFDGDLIKSIRDIGGHSTQSMHPFMLNTDAISKAFGDVQSIASREDCRLQDDARSSSSRSASSTPKSRASSISTWRSARTARASPCGHVSDFMLVEPRRLQGGAAGHPVRHAAGDQAPAGGRDRSTTRSGRSSTRCATSSACR